MRPSSIRYASSGEIRLAYQVVGHGSFDLVFMPGLPSNLEVSREEPGYEELLHRLSAFSRLIHFDQRGTGLSDRVDPERLPDLLTRMADIAAVMDAAGSGRAALLAASDGVAKSLLFATHCPERVRALVLFGGYAHYRKWVLNANAFSRFLAEVDGGWGSGATLRHFAPGRLHDPHFSQWWARYERLSASPSAAIALARMNADSDVRDLLPRIRVPTLVIHRSEDAHVGVEAGRFLARNIPGARLLELAGRDHAIWSGDVGRLVDAVEAFLTGMRPRPPADRVLAALLVARVVGPGRMSATLDDRRWLDRIERFRKISAETVRRLHGHVVRTDLERTLARFDGAARAAHCALALREVAAANESHVAQGLHVGEVEIQGRALGGFAVHAAERIAEHAAAGGVLASSLFAELAAGSGVHFLDHGSLALDGRERPLPLVAIATEQHLEPASRKPKAPEPGRLSRREREVLALVSDGLSNPAIASELRLSEHTVKRHVANILLKLDLPTRSAAAALAARLPSP